MLPLVDDSEHFYKVVGLNLVKHSIGVKSQSRGQVNLRNS